MIVAKINGGLGNQMFIWAAAYALAKAKSTDCIADISGYEAKNTDHNNTYRTFGLDEFPNWNFPKEYNSKYSNLFTRANLVDKFRKRRLGIDYYFEQNYQYSPEFWRNNACVYLDGYFQDENYFNSVRKDLLHIYSFDQLNLDSEYRVLLEQINSTLSIAVHIRRGDYATNQKINQIHGVLSLDYYKSAINYFAEQSGDSIFYFFSDDPDWARSQFKMDNCIVCDGSAMQSPMVDMYLMSRCKHNIIANSSFSWWSAWLNTNRDKQIVAPRNWFLDKNKNDSSKGIVPNEWIKL